MSKVVPADVDWHDSECRSFDYAQIDGTDLATCLGCGSTGPSLVSPVSPVSLPPLPSGSAFRLLRLEHGKFEDVVRCNVQLSNLRSEPIFNAISYTWADEIGDDRKLAKILLNGKPFRVTRNCDLALRRVRQRCYAASVWIDAICIDQSNDMERGHQVRLMPQIYQQATRVLMYIGEHDDDSREWFERLETLATTVGNFEGSEEISDNDRIQMWNAFKRRKYFTRLWVLQEVALARQATVLCGESSLSWNLIVDYGLGQDRIYTNLKHSVLGFNRFIVTEPDMELFVLDGGRRALCKDPRDKVYGLLGLLPGRCIGTIAADYQVSVQQLYTSLAVELARLHGWFAVLTRAGSRRQSLGSLPSWVPDWTCTANDRWTPKVNPLPAGLESDSVVVSKNTMRLNLFQSPTAPDRWFLTTPQERTLGTHLSFVGGGFRDTLPPSPRMTGWWDDFGLELETFRQSFFLGPSSHGIEVEARPCLVLQRPQSPRGPNQESECQTRVLQTVLHLRVAFLPVKQSIFPPLETGALVDVIYDKSDPLMVKNWLRPQPDASRSDIIGALQHAYSKSGYNASREWTLQAESLWAEAYKEETGILESWRRKKIMDWEVEFEESEPVKQEGKEEYLKARLENIDYEMNDLFWRLYVRQRAVRAQLVDIV